MLHEGRLNSSDVVWPRETSVFHHSRVARLLILLPQHLAGAQESPGYFYKALSAQRHLLSSSTESCATTSNFEGKLLGSVIHVSRDMLLARYLQGREACLL